MSTSMPSDSESLVSKHPGSLPCLVPMEKKRANLILEELRERQRAAKNKILNPLWMYFDISQLNMYCYYEPSTEKYVLGEPGAPD